MSETQIINEIVADDISDIKVAYYSDEFDDGSWIVEFKGDRKDFVFPLSKADDKDEAQAYALEMLNLRFMEEIPDGWSAKRIDQSTVDYTSTEGWSVMVFLDEESGWYRVHGAGPAPIGDHGSISKGGFRMQGDCNAFAVKTMREFDGDGLQKSLFFHPEDVYEIARDGGYKAVLESDFLKDKYQDVIDPVIARRVFEVRGFLRGLGWEGEPYKTLFKDGAQLKMEFIKTGAGRNCVGYSMNDIQDDLTLPSDQFAGKVDAAHQDIVESEDSGMRM